jgi:hypothetical protein
VSRVIKVGVSYFFSNITATGFVDRISAEAPVEIDREREREREIEREGEGERERERERGRCFP